MVNALIINGGVAVNIRVGQSVGQTTGLWGFQGCSECSLGRILKAHRRFSKGKPKALGQRFARGNLKGGFKLFTWEQFEYPRNLLWGTILPHNL